MAEHKYEYTEETDQKIRDDLVTTYDGRGKKLPRTFQVIGEVTLRNGVGSVVLSGDSAFTHPGSYSVGPSPEDDGESHDQATEYRVKYVSGRKFDIKAFGGNVPSEIVVRFVATGY